MRTGKWIRWVAIAPCLTLLGACGGGGSDTESSSTDDTESPLNAIFGGTESTAEMRAKDLEREQFVADCMKELGWDYVPVDYSAQFGNEEANADAELSPAEYGEKYAYGIVRNYELYELPYLLGEDPAEAPGGGDEFVDPNSEYVGSLSPEESEQYYRDLYGEQSFVSEEAIAVDDTVADTVYVAPPLEEQGCQGQAQREVYGESPWDNPDISTRMNELFEDMSNDAGIKAAQRDWKTCMADENADWDLETSDGTYQLIDRRKSELSGQEVIETTFDSQTGEPLDDSIDMSSVYTSNYGIDGEGYVVIGEPEALAEDELEQLRGEERALWEADQRCQKESNLRDAQTEAEQKLADTLLQEFPQLEKSTSGGEG